MEKEFVTYEIALELKELGFDEPCCGYFGAKHKKLIECNFRDHIASDIVKATIYQQAFRWFREKYNLCGEVYTINMGAIDYTFLIRDLYSEDVKYDNFEANTGGYSGTFNTYEEAELDCLTKLIEIAKVK